LVVRLARENDWGYTRILGELRKLGIQAISRNTVKSILKEHGLDPGPKRGEGTWDEFLKIHAKTLWQCDFLSKKVLTLKGFRDLYLLIFLHVDSRRVYISPSTFHPNEEWVTQQARQFLDHAKQEKLEVKKLMHDRDTKFTESFDGVFNGTEGEVKETAFRSPNTNAFVERFIQTLQQEVLDRFIVFGSHEGSLARWCDSVLLAPRRGSRTNRPYQPLANRRGPGVISWGFSGFPEIRESRIPTYRKSDCGHTNASVRLPNNNPIRRGPLRGCADQTHREVPMIASTRVSTSARQSSPVELSEADTRHLLAFERQRDFIRDRTRSVAEKYQNGCFLVGRAGTGKTRLVTDVLDQCDALWTYRNARMSAMGLYALLEEHPEHTILLDDIGSLFDQRPALQILLAALGGKPGGPRPITYTIKEKSERKSFDFTGGIIAISNVCLRRDPLADAVASRIPVFEHNPSDEQIAAFMRSRAQKGYEDLTPTECLDVVEYVIEASRRNDYQLDLRWMERGWQDYRFAKHSDALRSWQELISSSMKTIFHEPPPHVRSKQDELQLVRENLKRLMQMYPSDTAKQIEESGLTRSTFYQRRREIKQGL
jgi:hypothetical protein